MAIIGTQEDDDQQKQATTSASANAHASDDAAQGKPYQGASGASGFVGGTGTGSGQGATTGVGASSNAAASPNPGGYTNLSQYLAVNQGGGATTGQAAENVVQQSGDAAKSAQNDYSTAGMNDINTATTAAGVNQNVLGQISGGQANVDQATMDKINAGSYNYAPDKSVTSNIGAADQSKLDAAIKAGKDASAWSYGGPTDFSKVGYGGPSIDQITAQYTGPNTTSDFTGDTAAKQQAALAANDTAAGNVQNASGGQTGVSALLRQAYQQPQYSAGENNLDAFLAGGTEGGKAALSQASGVGQDVTGNYSKISDALSKAMQTGQDTAAATNKSYQDAINTATTNSAATQAKYNAAVKAAQDSGKASQKAAQDEAAKAQAEEDKRTAAAQLQAAQNVKPTPTVLRQVVNAGKNVINPVANDVKSLPQNLANAPSNVARDLAAAPTSQKALNNTATTVLTGGLNKVAPNMVSSATGAASKAGSDIRKTFGFARGGEIPSYGKLLSKLRGKR